jgi:hypothetical protein
VTWTKDPGPASVYRSGEFEIIYDPAGPVEGERGGWYVWKGAVQLGMRFTLADAKAFAEEAAAKSGTVQLSDRGLEHLQHLFSHRANLHRLVATIRPERCELCDEIQKWALAAAEATEEPT